MGSLTKNEPVTVATAIALGVGAVVGVLASWGIVITPEKKDSVILLLGAVYTIGGGAAAWWARRKSVPVATAQTAINTAYAATPNVDRKPTLANPTAAK